MGDWGSFLMMNKVVEVQVSDTTMFNRGYKADYILSLSNVRQISRLGGHHRGARHAAGCRRDRRDPG